MKFWQTLAVIWGTGISVWAITLIGQPDSCGVKLFDGTIFLSAILLSVVPLAIGYLAGKESQP